MCYSSMAATIWGGNLGGINLQLSGPIFCNLPVTPVGTQPLWLGLPRWASPPSYQLTLGLMVGTPTLVPTTSWYSTWVRDSHAGVASPFQYLIIVRAVSVQSYVITTNTTR